MGATRASNPIDSANKASTLNKDLSNVKLFRDATAAAVAPLQWDLHFATPL